MRRNRDNDFTIVLQRSRLVGITPVKYAPSKSVSSASEAAASSGDLGIAPNNTRQMAAADQDQGYSGDGSPAHQRLTFTCFTDRQPSRPTALAG